MAREAAAAGEITFSKSQWVIVQPCIALSPVSFPEQHATLFDFTDDRGGERHQNHKSELRDWEQRVDFESFNSNQPVNSWKTSYRWKRFGKNYCWYKSLPYLVKKFWFWPPWDNLFTIYGENHCVIKLTHIKY